MKRFFVGALGVTLLTLVVMNSPELRSNVDGLFLQGYWLMFALRDRRVLRSHVRDAASALGGTCFAHSIPGDWASAS
jgi:hypothetical protein